MSKADQFMTTQEMEVDLTLTAHSSPTHKSDLTPPAPSSQFNIFETQAQARKFGQGMNMGTQTEAVCKCLTEEKTMHKLISSNKTHNPAQNKQ